MIPIQQKHKGKAGPLTGNHEGKGGGGDGGGRVGECQEVARVLVEVVDAILEDEGHLHIEELGTHQQAHGNTHPGLDTWVTLCTPTQLALVHMPH